MRSEFNQLRERLWPHAEIVTALGGGDDRGFALVQMVPEEDCDGEQQNCGHQGHGPEAVDAPFFDDVGLEVAEEGCAGEANLGDLKREPIPLAESEDRYKCVAEYAKDGDGKVDLTGVGCFVEPHGWELSIAAMIDRAAIESFGDSAGRSRRRILIMDAKREGGVEDAGECEESDKEAHVCTIVRGLRRVGSISP